jgi:alpha-1,2-mannosyltransferase
VRLLTGETSTGLAVAACLSPAVLTMVAFGHFGGALAFLATYVLVRGKSDPMPAGICLGLMTVKPQFALVFALILILTGRWRVVAWSVPATVLLVSLSILAFGYEPWQNFITWTVPFHARLIATFAIDGMRTVISAYAAARLFGVPAGLAQLMQHAFSIAVLIQAILLVRRQGADVRTVALTVLTALAALPYVNAYDLAIAAPALTVALFAARAEDAPLLPFVPATLIWLAPIFSIPFGLLEWPAVALVFNAVLLLALFGPAGRLRTAGQGPPVAPAGGGFAL